MFACAELDKRSTKWYSTIDKHITCVGRCSFTDRKRERERERERENVIKSVYEVLSLTHKSWTTCSLEVITPGSRDILHVNSESLHLKLGVKIPFPLIDKPNHLQG